MRHNHYHSDDYIHMFIDIVKGLIFAFIVGIFILGLSVLITNATDLTDISFTEFLK